MYEVRLRGHWSGPVSHALGELDARHDGGDTVVIVRDHPELLALMNRLSDLGLEVQGVARRNDGGMGYGV